MNAKTRKDPGGKLIALRRVEGLPSEMSDEALLAACALGDSAALGALYDRLAPHLWRFLSRMTGQRVAELEDLVQATFVAVHRSAPSYRGTASVRTWVFAIASNVTRRHLRDEVRRRSAFERLAKLPPVPAGRPDESVEQQQLIYRMREALSALPYRLRISLVMCDLEGIPGRDAAAVLAIPEGTLYRRVHEARIALRALVEDGQL
jgi:RNA polymerase sigma-70 factor (ECF subfamily)